MSHLSQLACFSVGMMMRSHRRSFLTVTMFFNWLPPTSKLCSGRDKHCSSWKTMTGHRKFWGKHPTFLMVPKVSTNLLISVLLCNEWLPGWVSTVADTKVKNLLQLCNQCVAEEDKKLRMTYKSMFSQLSLDDLVSTPTGSDSSESPPASAKWWALKRMSSQRNAIEIFWAHLCFSML